MINYTARLDHAIRRAAWAHEQTGQHRKGTDIPYIVHPMGVMTIASNATEDEDILIACLMHDVLEDVDNSIYGEFQMRDYFGDRVTNIVKDVTKDESAENWHERSKAYLNHIEHEACEEAVIVCAADKIHNLLSTLMDHTIYGDDIWARFTTKNGADQLWWYESVLEVVKKREVPIELSDQLEQLVEKLREKL